MMHHRARTCRQRCCAGAGASTADRGPAQYRLTGASTSPDRTHPTKKPHTAKTERLRQAKAEAEKEIAAYRAEREAAYQKRLAEVRSVNAAPTSSSASASARARAVADESRRVQRRTQHTNLPYQTPPPYYTQHHHQQSSSGSAEMEERMRADTERQVEELKRQVAARKQGVVDMLARHVTHAPPPRPPAADK
jgi:V-type H+-transporting ATPase subunit G